MSDIGRQAILAPSIGAVITPFSAAALGYGPWRAISSFGGNVSAPVAGRGYFYPFVLNEPRTVYGFSWTNTTIISGTRDCGVYDTLGNRMCSIGAQTVAGSGARQSFSCTATVLRPGVYYLAFAAGGSTSQFSNQTGTTNGLGLLMCAGMKTVASGCSPLPSSVTLADLTANLQIWAISAHLNATF